MPGGRQLWMFSDTFFGPVNADGSRPDDTPIINNSFVLVDKDGLSTVHGGTDAEPTAVLAHPQQDHWYWLGASTLSNGVTGRRTTLDIMFPHFIRTGDGMWDFEWRSNVLGRFDPNTFEPLSTHRMPSSAHIQWASWLQRHRGHTYIYGVEDRGEQKHMHIARVVGSDLRRRWRFFDGTGWSPYESDSARVLTGVSNEYSVTPWRGGFLLVTQDTSTAFSPDILGYVADTPTGPFSSPTLLYRTPETGADGSYGDPDVFTYNPHEHPELRRGNRLLITYNVNSSFTDILADVTKYRPRFVEVTVD